MSAKMAVVTGGAGFLGSHLVEELVRRGWRVRVIDDLSVGRMKNLLSVKRQVDFRRVSILDSDLVGETMKDADVVFHLAAKVSVAESLARPELYARVNVAGLLTALEGARKHSVARFVFPSSAAVYGNDPKLPKTERSGLDPRSPYAVTKVLGEALCRVYHEDHGLETVALRLFNVYGARQNPRSPYASVIPRFIDAMAQGKRPVIFGDGRQTRDFIHVDDAVLALRLAAEKRGASGEVLNIASGKGTTILDLLETLRDVGGWKVKPRFAPPRVGEVRHSRASVAEAHRLLGFRTQVTLEDGLQRVVAAI